MRVVAHLSRGVQFLYRCIQDFLPCRRALKRPLKSKISGTLAMSSAKKSPRRLAIGELIAKSRESPEFVEMIGTLGALETESRTPQAARAVRSSILIATGFVEHALEVAILSRFRVSTDVKYQLFGFDPENDGVQGVLGTFYAKIVIAHCLDIFGPMTMKDLNTVRHIRNICAHAKNDSELSEVPLTTLCSFHIINHFDETFKPTWAPRPAVNKLLRFIEQIVPYLLLHQSKEWLGSVNRQQWRESFS